MNSDPSPPLRQNIVTAHANAKQRKSLATRAIARLSSEQKIAMQALQNADASTEEDGAGSSRNRGRPRQKR